MISVSGWAILTTMKFLKIIYSQLKTTDQNSGNAAKVQMGLALISSNACGWVAAYNAFRTLEMPSAPAYIVRYLENNNGLIVDGVFGVNPAIYDFMFGPTFSPTTIYATEGRNLDKLAQESDTVILTYFNEGYNGAHYINLHWDSDAKQYIAYNARQAKFDSIYDYLFDYGFTFISMTTLTDKRNKPVLI